MMGTDISEMHLLLQQTFLRCMSQCTLTRYVLSLKTSDKLVHYIVRLPPASEPFTVQGTTVPPSHGTSVVELLEALIEDPGDLVGVC